MDTIRKLTKDDFAKTREIFLDSFFDNGYFCELFPDEKTRLNFMDKHVITPLNGWCLEHGESYCLERDGVIVGYQMIAEYNAGNAPDVEAVFFDPAIKYGDEPKRLFKEAVRETFKKYGPLAYFYAGVTARTFRRQGIGAKLIRACIDIYKDRPIVTELTSPEIIKLFDNFKEERDVISKKIDDSYCITTVMPLKYN